jgi:hypothetical protein
MKGLKIGVLSLLVAFTIAACNNSGEETVSKPIGGESEVVATKSNKAVNTKGDEDSALKGYDPLKDQKNEQARVPSSSESLPVTSIKFNEIEHDFGTIDEGDRVEHTFVFTNTGTEPLVLENCKGSCGCTVPECPKVPILPGEQGKIEVVFNSKGKKNSQTKRVTVTANTAPVQSTLTIKAFVTPEEELSAN